MKNGQARFFARAMIFVTIVGTFSSLAINLPDVSAGDDYPVAIPYGVGDVGLMEYETPIGDITPDFTDYPPIYFPPDGDYDNDRLSNGYEMEEKYCANFQNSLNSPVIYEYGDPLYVYNSVYNYQRRIPQEKIRQGDTGSLISGDVYLYDIGFHWIDFTTENVWYLTDGATYPDYPKTYSYVMTTTVMDAEDPWLLFYFQDEYKSQTINVCGKTNPFDPDTDNDGRWDGDEVNHYYTNPIDADTDDDGVWDPYDTDPLVDLWVIVEINEILELESPDGEDNCGDYYARVYVDGELLLTPHIDGGNGRNYPNWKLYKDVLDTKTTVEVRIELYDYDPGDNEDEHMDIARHGRNVDVTYDLRTGVWVGDDDAPIYAKWDRNGLGHTIGFEDNFYGENECEIWFDIYQDDIDGDRLTYWQELYRPYHPRISNYDTDGDGMPDWWELRYNFDREVPDGDEDFDHDNLSNYEEWLEGTDPTFFEANLIISLNWDANTEYLLKLYSGLKSASNFLWDVTDGYMYFKRIVIYDKSEHWYDADVHIYAGTADNKEDHHWPKARVGGIWIDDGYITMPQKFDHDNWWTGSEPDNSDWWKTLVHEWGHYGLFLYDEYKGPDGDAECIWCIMDNQYDISELCTRWNHDIDGDTNQEHENNESCWETFFDVYKDIIWFDLDEDGERDTSFYDDYRTNQGPHAVVHGAYTRVYIDKWN